MSNRLYILCLFCLVVVVVVLSPISTFSIEQSRKNGFKFGSHVQVMCKSCSSHVQVMFKSCSRNVQVMCKTCSSHVQVMYKSCQFSHRLGDWTVFSLVSIVFVNENWICFIFWSQEWSINSYFFKNFWLLKKTVRFLNVNQGVNIFLLCFWVFFHISKGLHT